MLHFVDALDQRGPEREGSKQCDACREAVPSIGYAFHCFLPFLLSVNAEGSGRPS
jgi:hypothetical protein